MNKKLIALAVAAVASTSVSAAEIFNDGTSSLAIGGRAEARAAIKDGDVNDNSRVRLNVMGTTQIAEGAYGIGFFEQEFTTNDALNKNGNDETRYLFAGIGSDYGLVTYGKNDGSLGMITDFTDIMAYHGAGASEKLTVADRTDNNFAYMGEFGGLTVKANYVSDTVNEKTGVEIRNGGYSLGAVYAMENGLAMGLGYADQGKDTLSIKEAKEESQIQAAVSYTFGDFYVAALYKDGEEQKAGVKTDLMGYEFAAAYTMGQTKFTTTYNKAESETGSVKKDTYDSVAIDATHFFNDNFRAYASYNFNLLDEKDVAYKLNAEDELVFGLRYDF
ncbi:porin [Grimontia hollisae]|uniref:Outer membrane porin protein OmpD n=1 Tax=Grimontia hollisae TaxID=673 RepID=A0A377HRJ3_GRIHO|nr:porin [Grimontia hollisae]STO58345.1 Outer membrane porin protein OmpD precursor [Grimontia hollisae]